MSDQSYLDPQLIRAPPSTPVKDSHKLTTTPVEEDVIQITTPSKQDIMQVKWNPLLLLSPIIMTKSKSISYPDSCSIKSEFWWNDIGKRIV